VVLLARGVVSELILYNNHPLAPSLARRGVNTPIPLLSEEGARGWRLSAPADLKVNG